MTEAAVARSRQLDRMRTAAGGLAAGSAAWPLAVAAICFTLTAARIGTTADSYLDLVCGRLIVAHGIPHVDVLSVAGHGRPWIDQQWLAQVTMYGVWRAFGHAGVGLLFALLLAAAYGLLTRLCVQLAAPPQRAMCWALLAFLGCLGYASVRSEMFSYPAFVLVLTLLVGDLRRDAPGRSFLWLFVVLGLWANVHGGVVLGVLLTVVYCAARAGLALRRRDLRPALTYAGSSVASVLCLFATPYGFSEARYYRGVFSSSILRQYENEWTSPRLTYLFDWMTFFFLIAIAALGVLALRKRYVPNPVLILAAAVSCALTFHAMRNQPWFSISAAALVAITLGALRPAPPPLSERFLRLGMAALAGVAIVVTASAVRAPQARSEVGLERGALAAAAQWSVTHPGAKILADESASDRLLWWYPSTAGRVALDGRLDFYEQSSMREWFGYIFGPRVPATISGSRYDVYLAAGRSYFLYGKLEHTPCLRTLHADRFGIAVVRDDSAPSCTAAGD